MRPINRGKIPAKNAGNIQFTDHKQARDYLIQRIGDYCSYCEMPKPDGPDVEHKRPQKHYPQYSLSWNNFLLSCRYCNSIKGYTNIILNRYYWPDSHNTFLALSYTQSGPIPSANLNSTQNAKAMATIQLTGLDRRPGHSLCTLRDTRWRKRQEVWEIAERSLANLNKNNTQHMREQILISAKGHGFWSVWVTVFKNKHDILQLLIEEFPGTERDCFDSDCQAKDRKSTPL